MRVLGAPATTAHLYRTARLGQRLQVPVELGSLHSGHAHEFAYFEAIVRRGGQRSPKSALGFESWIIAMEWWDDRTD